MLCCILILAAGRLAAFERRQEQFKSNGSYLILPAPYSAPGVGQGIVYTALAANIADTYVDVWAMRATGAAEGYMLGLYDLFPLTDVLYFDFHKIMVSKVAFNNYSARGIETEKDDYTILQYNQMDENFGSVRLTLFERRAEAYMEYMRTEATIKKILDNEGEVQTEFEDPSSQSVEQTKTGFRLDITDDYLDPRMGVRFEMQKIHSPPIDDDESDYYVINRKLSVYIPVLEHSVLAFFGMSSDATVTKVGETDPDIIASDLGLACSYDDCSENEQNLVDRIVVEREKGTATKLGGFDYLRSYPLDRFQGAFVRYYSTELRFNFANEVTPFNFWIWKDISTSIQCVLFYDWGTVAETEEELGEDSADSVGLGLRMVAGSGYVYRADWATGKEGSNVTVVFQYPW